MESICATLWQLAFLMHAEATGVQTVRVAHAAREQYGADRECDTVAALATQPESGKHAIQAAHSAFRKAGLRLNVKVTELSGDCQNMHVIYLSDFISFMGKNGQLHRFLGGLGMDEVESVLRVFWDRFRRIHPDHEAIEDIGLGRSDPGCLIPYLVHGDEGRGACL